MLTDLIQDVAIIMGLSLVALVICKRLRLPEILGFLISGIIANNFFHGINTHDIEMLSEIGIILLLFSLGIEFSFAKIRHIGKLIFVGGIGQLLLTSLAGFVLLFTVFELSILKSILIAIFLSFSSTAIVMKYLQSNLEIESPHGKASLGILIFQDMSVILLLLLIPIMAGQLEYNQIIWQLFKAFSIIALIIFLANIAVPFVLRRIVRYRSQELFLLTTVVICLVIAYITSSVGLSLSIGAFLAGLAISESEYHAQALNLITPFRDIFLSFFFISIGLLLDINFLFQNFIYLIGAVGLLLIIKFSVLTGIMKFLKLPLRNSILTGIYLFQVGEFIFIIASEALQNNLLSDYEYKFIISLATISMAITPLMITCIKYIVNHKLYQDILFNKPDINNQYTVNSIKSINTKTPEIIIIGYGLNGRWLKYIADTMNKQYLILEINPDTVEQEQKQDTNIIYANASNSLIWQNLHSQQILNNIQTIFIVMSDSVITPLIIDNIRQYNKDVSIIIRTRFVTEHENLAQIDKNIDLVCHDLESTLELSRKLLGRYNCSEDKSHSIINYIKEQQEPPQ